MTTVWLVTTPPENALVCSLMPTALVPLSCDTLLLVIARLWVTTDELYACVNIWMPTALLPTICDTLLPVISTACDSVAAPPEPTLSLTAIPKAYFPVMVDTVFLAI